MSYTIFDDFQKNLANIGPTRKDNSHSVHVVTSR